jgi:cytoskeletal protein CcmA (bactofilin family)
MSLWQKPDQPDQPSVHAAPPSLAVTPGASRHGHRSDTLVNIGQSVQIKGELSGNEDLIIDGKIEGRINLKDHHLTVGANGRITAEIHAKSVLVNGEVIGNIIADDKVEIAPSGSVDGDISAPRVALADGSCFKGSIDMGRKAAAPQSARPNTVASAVTQQVSVAAAAKS